MNAASKKTALHQGRTHAIAGCGGTQNRNKLNSAKKKRIFRAGYLFLKRNTDRKNLMFLQVD